jgi:hypothetical protein
MKIVGKFYGHNIVYFTVILVNFVFVLVYFVVFWVNFPRFGTLSKKIWQP